MREYLILVEHDDKYYTKITTPLRPNNIEKFLRNNPDFELCMDFDFGSIKSAKTFFKFHSNPKNNPNIKIYSVDNYKLYNER